MPTFPTDYISHHHLQDPNLEPAISVYLYPDPKTVTTSFASDFPTLWDNTNKRFDCTYFMVDIDPVTFQSEVEQDVTDILSSRTAFTIIKDLNKMDGISLSGLSNDEKEFVFDITRKVSNVYKNAFTIAGYNSDGLFADFEIELNIKNESGSINETETLFRGKLNNVQSDLTTSKIFLVDALIEARRKENSIGKTIYNEVIKYEDLFKMAGESGDDWEGDLEEKFDLNRVNQIRHWGLSHSPIIKPKRNSEEKVVYLEVQRSNPYLNSKSLDKINEEENIELHEIYNNFNYIPGNQIEKLFTKKESSWKNFEVNYEQGSLEFESPPIMQKDGSIWIKQYKTAYRYKSPSFLIKELFKELGYSDFTEVDDKTIDVFYPSSSDTKKYVKKAVSKLGQVSPSQSGVNTGVKDMFHSKIENLYYYIGTDGIYKTDLKNINIKVVGNTQKPKETKSDGTWGDVSGTKIEKLKLQQVKTFKFKENVDSNGVPIAGDFVMRMVVSVARDIEFTYDNPYNIPYQKHRPTSGHGIAYGLVRDTSRTNYFPNRDKIFNWCYSPKDSFDNLRMSNFVGGIKIRDKKYLDVYASSPDDPTYNYWYTGNFNTHSFNNWRKNTIFELYYYDYRVSDLYYELDNNIYKKPFNTSTLKYDNDIKLFSINHSAENIRKGLTEKYTSSNNVEITGVSATSFMINYGSLSLSSSYIGKYETPTPNDKITFNIASSTHTFTVTGVSLNETTSNITVTHSESVNTESIGTINEFSISFPEKLFIYYDGLSDDYSWEEEWKQEAKRTPTKFRQSYSLIEANSHKVGTPIQEKRKYPVTKDDNSSLEVGTNIKKETFDPSKIKEFDFELGTVEFLKPFDHYKTSSGSMIPSLQTGDNVPKFIRRLFYGDNLTNNFQIVGEDDTFSGSGAGWRRTKAKLLVFELVRTMESRIARGSYDDVPQIVNVDMSSSEKPDQHKQDFAPIFIDDGIDSWEESGINTNKRIYISDIKGTDGKVQEEYLTHWSFNLSYWKVDQDVILTHESFYGGGGKATSSPTMYSVYNPDKQNDYTGNKPPIHTFSHFHSMALPRASKLDSSDNEIFQDDSFEKFYVEEVHSFNHTNAWQKSILQKRPILDSFIGADLIIEGDFVYALYNDTIFEFYYNSSDDKFQTLPVDGDDQFTHFEGHKTKNIFFRLNRNPLIKKINKKEVFVSGFQPSTYMTDGNDIPSTIKHANLNPDIAELWGKRVFNKQEQTNRDDILTSSSINSFIHSFQNMNNKRQKESMSTSVNDVDKSYIFIGVGNRPNWYYRVSQVYGLNKVKGKRIFGFYSVNRDYTSKKTRPREKYDEFGKIHYYRNEHDKSFVHLRESCTAYHNLIDFDETKETSGSPKLRISSHVMPSAINQVYYDTLRAETEELENERDKANRDYMKPSGLMSKLIPLGIAKEAGQMIEHDKFITIIDAKTRGQFGFSGDVAMSLSRLSDGLALTPYKSKYFPYCFVNSSRLNETRGSTSTSDAEDVQVKRTTYAPAFHTDSHYFYKFDKTGDVGQYRVAWKRLFWNLNWFNMHKRRTLANEHILPSLLPKTSSSIGNEIVHLIGNQGEYKTTREVTPLLDIYANDQTRYQFGTSLKNKILYEDEMDAVEWQRWRLDIPGYEGGAMSYDLIDTDNDGVIVLSMDGNPVYNRSYKSEGISDYNTQDTHGSVMITPYNYGIPLTHNNPHKYESEIIPYPHNLGSENIYKDFASKPLIVNDETTGSDAIHFICGRSIGNRIVTKEKITKDASGGEIYQEEKLSDPLESQNLYDNNNFMWTTLDDVLHPRIPLADFSNMTIYDAMKNLAIVMGYTFGIKNGKPFFKDRDNFHYHVNPDTSTTDTRSYFTADETTYDLIRNWDANLTTNEDGTDKYNNKYWFWDGEIIYLSTLADSQTVNNIKYIKTYRKQKNSTIHPNKFVPFLSESNPNDKVFPSGANSSNVNLRPRHMRNSLLYEVKAIVDEEIIIDIQEYQKVYDSNYTDIHATYSDGKVLKHKIQETTEESRRIYSLNIPYIDNKQWVEWLILRISRNLSIDRYKIVLTTKILPSLKGSEYIAIYNKSEIFGVGSLHTQGKVFELFKVNSVTHDVKGFTSTITAFSVDTSSQYISYNNANSSIGSN